MQIKTIGIVGAGTMGHGIASVAAQSGFEVWLGDISEELARKGLGKIEASWGKLVEKGKMAADVVETAKRKIHICKSLADIKDCDLVIEAVTESVKIKQDLFAELNRGTKKDTVLATNTSSVSITLLAAASHRPAKFVGMHFFNPVPVMRLVEIIRGLQTSDETFKTAWDVAVALGKTPAGIKDSPGFAVNRLLLPLVNEAFYVLQEGIADAKTIDSVMQLGANHPMGPLTLGDFVGLDVTLAAMEVLHRDLGEDKYRPCPLLRKYVESGWLGRKSGRGVYDYTAQK
ncbi:MAG: 3-hydroxybutyryl-CoA dehydrogenase [Deltaproteobacteria bacterium]|nr:3-hydroxybutyryl-CoA dehydrogenase [Deltaproteobacteria bacterium]